MRGGGKDCFVGENQQAGRGADDQLPLRGDLDAQCSALAVDHGCVPFVHSCSHSTPSMARIFSIKIISPFSSITALRYGSSFFTLPHTHT